MMLRNNCFLTEAMAVLLLVGWAWAGNEDTNQPPPTLRLELDLTDGSHVVGVPKIEAVPLQTAYARMEIPLKQISRVKVADDHETVSLDLRNGDRLQGVISLKPLELTTVFGPVKIGIEHLREIAVVSSAEGLPAALMRGLVLYYTFDRDEGDKVIDRSGKGNDGVISGARRVSNDRSGGAVAFDGLGGQSVRSRPNGFFSGNQDYTLAVRVNIGEFRGQGEDRPIVWYGGEGREDAAALVVNGQRLSSLHYLDDCAFADYTPPLHAWINVAVVYTKADRNVRLFVDGQMRDQSVHNGLNVKTVDKLALGTSTDGQRRFTGIIDDVMVFDRALSPEEIQALHKAR